MPGIHAGVSAHEPAFHRRVQSLKPNEHPRAVEFRHLNVEQDQRDLVSVSSVQVDGLGTPGNDPRDDGVTAKQHFEKATDLWIVVHGQNARATVDCGARVLIRDGRENGVRNAPSDSGKD